jgi:hypothetical protein
MMRLVFLLLVGVGIVHAQPLLEEVCRGTLLVNHSVLATSKGGGKVVREPLAHVDPMMCDVFWGRTTAHEALLLLRTRDDYAGQHAAMLESVSLDDGAVTYHGPSRQFANQLAHAAQPDPYGVSDMACILATLTACAHLGYAMLLGNRAPKSWNVHVGSLLIMAALLGIMGRLNAWSVPRFPALDQFERAVVARTQGAATLDACAGADSWTPPPVKSNSNTRATWWDRISAPASPPHDRHHWWTGRECLCVWHRTALIEVETAQANPKSMALLDIDWFHGKSAFRRSAVERILLRHGDEMHVRDVTRQAQATHRAIDAELEDMQRRIRTLDQQVVRLKRKVEDTRDVAFYGASSLASHNNASFPMHMLAHAAGRVAADHLASDAHEEMDTLAWRRADLVTRLAHAKRTKQMPHVHRLWEALHATMPWFKSGC